MYEELFLFMNVFVFNGFRDFSWYTVMILSDVIVFVLFELLTCVIMDDVSGCDERFLPLKVLKTSRWTGFGGSLGFCIFVTQMFHLVSDKK